MFRGKQGHTDLSALISHFVGVHFSRKWASTSSSNFQIECPSSLLLNHLAESMVQKACTPVNRHHDYRLSPLTCLYLNFLLDRIITTRDTSQQHLYRFGGHPGQVAEAQAGSVGYSSMRVNDNPRPSSSFYSTRLSSG